MKSHPILFSAPMVQSLLADRKTQTRRLSESWMKVKSGDELWVRETFCVCDGAAYGSGQSDRMALYSATYTGHSGMVWRPCIHMPRWASRITLRATADARRESLQEITEQDAVAEGIMLLGSPKVGEGYGHEEGQHYLFDSARDAYAELWNRLHGKDAPWNSNPTVTVVSFEVVAGAGAR